MKLRPSVPRDNSKRKHHQLKFKEQKVIIRLKYHKEKTNRRDRLCYQKRADRNILLNDYLLRKKFVSEETNAISKET